MDFRDREDMTQICFGPQNDLSASLLPTFKDESVIEILDSVRLRPNRKANSSIATGKTEVTADTLTIYDIAETLYCNTNRC
jgi:aspartyl-tRNA synthetase